MMNLWEHKEEYQKAFEYSVKYGEASEALNKRKNQVRIDELQTRYEFRLFKRENELLNNSLRNERLKAIFGFGLLGIFLLGGVYTVRFFKLKIQTEKTERLRVAKINALREKELEQAKIIIELKDQFIKEKERELIDYATERSRLNEEIKQMEQNLLNKNNLALSKGLERLKSFSQEGNSLVLEKFRALNPVLQSNLSRPEYGLTRSEIEFCMLLSMRLTNKEIARTLNISQSSVATKKYRMLPKLSIASNQDFDSWLRQQAETDK
jgi:DNA-binding CsgD family transcriptional regulator